jgi:hypothetical protein
MQDVLGRLAAALVALAMLAPAPAGAVSLTHDPAPDPLCLSTAAPSGCGDAAVASYAFSLTLGGVTGIITDAGLLLSLWDDQIHEVTATGKKKGDGSEKIDVTLDGVLLVHHADVQHDLLIALPDLSTLGDGQLDVVLAAHKGDFYFGGAALTLDTAPVPPPIVAAPVPGGGPPSGAVPAPAALLLLGAGATAVAWIGRPARQAQSRG